MKIDVQEGSYLIACFAVRENAMCDIIVIMINDTFLKYVVNDHIIYPCSYYMPII